MPWATFSSASAARRTSRSAERPPVSAREGEPSRLPLFCTPCTGLGADVAELRLDHRWGIPGQRIMSLIHDRAAHRFRLPLEGGGEAYIEYAERGSATLDLLHTRVPPEDRGRGNGSELVEQVLRYARDNGLRVVPSCPFVSAHLRRHHEHEDLIA